MLFDWFLEPRIKMKGAVQEGIVTTFKTTRMPNFRYGKRRIFSPYIIKEIFPCPFYFPKRTRHELIMSYFFFLFIFMSVERHWVSLANFDSVTSNVFNF